MTFWCNKVFCRSRTRKLGFISNSVTPKRIRTQLSRFETKWEGCKKDQLIDIDSEASKMPRIEKNHLKSTPEAGAGSPGEASSVAVAADATETEELVKQLLGMGFPEGPARIALAGCNNNVELAVQLLVAGEDSRKQRRGHQGMRQLRRSLLGTPFSTNKAIEEMMRNSYTVQGLTDSVAKSGVEAMQLLLADEDLGSESPSSAESSSASDSAEN